MLQEKKAKQYAYAMFDMASKVEYHSTNYDALLLIEQMKEDIKEMPGLSYQIKSAMHSIYEERLGKIAEDNELL